MDHKSVEHTEFVSSGKGGVEPDRLTPARIMTPEQFALAERKLKKKLDLRLLLCVWVIFVMNYLDRVISPSLCTFDGALMIKRLTWCRTTYQPQR